MKISIVYIALLTSCVSLSNKEEKMMCFEIEKNDIFNFLIDKNYELLWSGVFSHVFKRL